ncbi:hypothetical protein AB0O14_09230 [Microbacterium foliorum]
MDEKIALSLSTSEALVLYEWLARDKSSQHASGAERRVLWDIEAQLESELPMLFDADYQDQVARARNDIEAGPPRLPD